MPHCQVLKDSHTGLENVECKEDCNLAILSDGQVKLERIDTISEEDRTVGQVKLERLGGIPEEEQDSTRNSPSCSGATTASNFEYTHWSRNFTLRVIEEYGNNHSKLGSAFRSLEVLYEDIAKTLNTEFGLHLTGALVNNKFQSLLRSYKTVVENKKTGRENKYFEFEKEMDQIFQKSRGINSKILCSGSEVIESTTFATENTSALKDLAMNAFEPAKAQARTSRNLKRKILSRTEVLEEMRRDKKKFYEEYRKIKKAKLIESKIKNELIDERNRLLKLISKRK